MSHRAATAALPLVLIAACAAAFLRTEQLKLHHSPVGHPHIRQAISPGCGDPGCRPVAHMRFTLRQAQALTLAMVRPDGTLVRTLVSHRSYPKTLVRVTWDGTTGGGARARDGRYALRVTLADGRNVTIPDAVVVDTVPPDVTIGSVRHGPSALTIRFSRSKGTGRTLLVVSRGGAVVLQKRVRPHVCRLRYDALAPGRYSAMLVAVDRAGNRTPDPPTFPVTIR